MNSKYFILPVYFLCAEFIVQGHSCRELKQIRTPYTVQKTRLVYKTYRNFLGFTRVKTQQEVYTDVDYYDSVEYQCCQGYSETMPDICEPICSPECPSHSHCIEPDTCNCDLGYYSLFTDPVFTDCKPKCEGCPPHSSCVAPGRCECDAGYQELAIATCHAVCQTACPENAFCSAPNECQCNVGYNKNPDTGDCEPICSLGCPANGVCVAPENCACLEDYHMNGNKTQCIPQCEDECPEHSICYRPNECLCDEGYRNWTWPASKQSVCEPICQDNCEPRGKCAAPNQCECYTGYELQSENLNISQCQPVCSSGCKNGFCFAPETCVCNPGFLMGPNNTCTPVCSRGCINGLCIEPDVCECNAGFEFHNNSSNECRPVCEPACINADCIAPNICFCWMNFQYATDLTEQSTPSNLHKCLPSCQPQCANGTCLEGNICSCETGFYTSQYERDEQIMRICVPHSLDDVSSTLVFSTEVVSTEVDVDQTTYAGVKWLPAEVCQQQCTCWQTHFEASSLSTSTTVDAYNAECLEVCLDSENDTCINLSNCLCDWQSLTLKCDEDVTASPFALSTDSYEHNNQFYRCTVFAFATTEAIDSMNNETISELKSSPTWLWPVVLISTLLMVISLAGIVYGLRKRRLLSFQKGTYSVQYSNQTAS